MNECKLHFYKTLESIGEVYMTELNIILVLLLLISTLVLHGKLNRIEKMLRQPGTDKNPLPVPRFIRHRKCRSVKLRRR